MREGHVVRNGIGGIKIEEGAEFGPAVLGDVEEEEAVGGDLVDDLVDMFLIDVDGEMFIFEFPVKGSAFAPDEEAMDGACEVEAADADGIQPRGCEDLVKTIDGLGDGMIPCLGISDG